MVEMAMAAKVAMLVAAAEATMTTARSSEEGLAKVVAVAMMEDTDADQARAAVQDLKEVVAMVQVKKMATARELSASPFC